MSPAPTPLGSPREERGWKVLRHWGQVAPPLPRQIGVMSLSGLCYHGIFLEQ